MMQRKTTRERSIMRRTLLGAVGGSSVPMEEEKRTKNNCSF